MIRAVLDGCPVCGLVCDRWRTPPPSCACTVKSTIARSGRDPAPAVPARSARDLPPWRGLPH
jgi:hypothetical protein